MFNQDFLKKLRILYVEDDIEIADKFRMVLSSLFKEAVICRDGEEGYETFKQSLNQKDQFDVIISDINMPNMNGIEMLKAIKEIDKNIPFIFTTAYSDSKFTIEAIKYGVSHYAIKPINAKEILLHIQQICEVKFQQKIILNTQTELQQYIDVIDQVAIISKTDPEGVITFVNDIFCEVAKYTREELIGKNQNIVRHPDMPSSVFEQMWIEIKDGKTWKGKVKNKTKDGEAYYVNANIFPIFDDSNEKIIEYVGIRFLTTEDEIKNKEFKKKVIQNFQESKRKDIVARTKIDQLKTQVETLESKLKDYGHVDLLKDAIEQEKQNNKIYKNQAAKYENDLKELSVKYEDIVSVSNNSIKEAKERQKNAQEVSLKMRRAYDKMEHMYQSKDEELKEVLLQLKSQAKIIKDLKEVIEHREDQLAKTNG